MLIFKLHFLNKCIQNNDSLFHIRLIFNVQNTKMYLDKYIIA